MTIKEFSKLSGKSENAIRRKLERGTLEGKKINGHWEVFDTVYQDFRFRSWNRLKGRGKIEIDV